MTVVALMYHRVAPRRPDTACYFERGTAVEPAVFAAQLAWVAARCPIIAPHAIAGWPDDQLAVVLTFDDGYRDVIDAVRPVCRAHRAPYAVYPIAGHLAESPTATWFDRYYDLVQRARWSGAVARRLARALPAARGAPDPTADLRWWVRGPLKARLSAEPAAREALLSALADGLGVSPDPALARRLYLSADALGQLAREGVTIGGHGVAHHRMGDVAPAVAQAEVAGAAQMLERLAIARPWSYAYPDGSYDAAAVARVEAAGFTQAFTVEPGGITTTADPLRLPRVIARNLMPTDPRWAAAPWIAAPAPTEEPPP